MSKKANKKIEIASTLDELVNVESFLEELNTELKFKEDVYGNVMIAVTEAVNNGIFHGNKQNSAKRVKIASELLNPFLLSITVEDEGVGFDMNKIKDPTATENLLNENGRGIFVIKHLTDFFEYKGRGNILEMRFNI